jgi:hypothetical protein
MPLTEANIDGSRWTMASFAVASSSSVTGLAPAMPRSSLMNSTRAASVFSLTTSPPVRNWPGPLPNAKSDRSP